MLLADITSSSVAFWPVLLRITLFRAALHWLCCVDDAHLSACCLDARRERLTLQLQACICVEHRSQPKPVSDSASTGEPTVLSSSPSLMRMGLAAEPKAASHSVPDQPICDQ